MPFLLRVVYLGTLLALLASATSGCATTSARDVAVTSGKVVLTPLTVARDVVDAPLVSVANGMEFFAAQTRLAKAPGANVGWSWQGGFNFGVGYDVSWLLFKGLSGVFGGVDYVVCRSLWPNWAGGISPWRHEGQTWGSLYMPNTRVLWGDDTPLYQKRVREGRASAAPPPAVDGIAALPPCRTARAKAPPPLP